VVETYSKLELGGIQLDRALSLFLDEGDYVSAITLAHAAQELLDDWYRLKVRGDPLARETALRSDLDATMAFGRLVLKVDLDEKKDVAPLLNGAANALKHGGGDPDLTLDFEFEARDVLDRAIRNYQLCTGNYPTRVSEFDAIGRRKAEEVAESVPE
jgi:hypothetical protein